MATCTGPFDEVFDLTLRKLLAGPPQNLSAIVQPRCSKSLLGRTVLNREPYLTVFPIHKTYGECVVGLPDPTVAKIFTCEVRWGASKAAWSIARLEDREEFVFAGALVRLVSNTIRESVAALGARSTTHFTDTWKPLVKDGALIMMRLYTIEIRVDFKDEDKLPLFEKLIVQAGRHVYGQSALLGDGVKPEIVMHAHDFFKGHQDIALFDDAVLAGDHAVEEAAANPSTPVSASAPAGSSEGEGGFSEEFLSELAK